MENNLSQRKMKVYTNKNYLNIPELSKLDSSIVDDIGVLEKVFPFKVNNYVLENLINWDDVPNDSIYRLVFPHKDMLSERDYNLISNAIKEDNSNELEKIVYDIRMKMNPHPAGQMEQNVPTIDNKRLEGIQHKYVETVLFFPKEGQTCHSYCSYCFRWPQFINDKDLKFSSSKEELSKYLKISTNVTDILFTGGDPMILSAKKLADYMELLLEPEYAHIKNIRIGTKSLSYWPYRYVSDNDSDVLFELFEKLIKNDKNLFIMAHFSHWKEMEQDIAVDAIKKLKSIGVSIYSQAPILKHINDSSSVWKRLWKNQIGLDIVPYYMFIARNTGANEYFKVPIYKALEIFIEVISHVSGLTKTVRGPVMSTIYGKIGVEGISIIKGKKYFVLRFIQGRNVDWLNKPFFAEYCEKAAWIDELKPAFGEEKFFFQKLV